MDVRMAHEGILTEDFPLGNRTFTEMEGKTISGVAIGCATVGTILCLIAFWKEKFQWRRSKFVMKKGFSILWCKFFVDLINTINALWISINFFINVPNGDFSNAHKSTLCQSYAGVQLFTSRASSMWFLVWSIDIFLAVRNPFCTATGNKWKYHIAAWGFSALIVFLSILGNQLNEAPYTYCWMDQMDTQELWTLFFAQFPLPRLVAILFATFVVIRVFGAMKRINVKATAGLCVRKALLTKSSTLLIVFGIVALYKFGVVIATMVRPPHDQDNHTIIMYTVFESAYLFLHGLANLIATIIVQRWTQRLVVAHKISEHLPQQHGNALEEMRRGWGDNVDDQGNLVDNTNTAKHTHRLGSWITTKNIQRKEAESMRSINLSESEYLLDEEEMNQSDEYMLKALRDDVMLCTLFGIISTLNRHSRTTKPIMKQTVMLPPIFNREIEFIDYFQSTFADLRASYGIKPRDYAASIWGKEMRKEIQKMTEQFSSGRSGSFFYLTHDKRFLIKTITAKEKKTLIQLLPSYATYVKLNQSTLLVRFCGLHAVRLTKEQRFISFIVCQHVMNDASYRPRIDRIYDLKGSTQNRGEALKSPGWGQRFLRQLRKFFGINYEPPSLDTPPILGSKTPPVKKSSKKKKRANKPKKPSSSWNSPATYPTITTEDEGNEDAHVRRALLVSEKAGDRGWFDEDDVDTDDVEAYEDDDDDDDEALLTGDGMGIDFNNSTITSPDGDVISMSGEAMNSIVKPLFANNFKDKDLIAHGKVKIGQKAKSSLSSRLTCDVAFLHAERIMDFSLLIGIHFCDETCNTNSGQLAASMVRGIGDGMSSIYSEPDVDVSVHSNNGNLGHPMQDNPSYGTWLDKKSLLQHDTHPSRNSSTSRHSSRSSGGHSCHANKNKIRKDGVVRDRFGRVDLRQGVSGTFNGMPCIVYFGVVDILQRFDGEKQLETFLKTTIGCYETTEISSVNPDLYCQRFHKRVLQYVE